MTYTNIKLIMDSLTKHPLLEDIPFEVVVDYAVDFIRLVGTPPYFLEKTQEIDIVDYRGELPCDFYQMIQVRTKDLKNRTIAFRYSSDSFHMSKHKPTYIEYTYKIQGNCIFTTVEKGKIEIAYEAMPIDEDGYPLIPDNSAYSRALERYIKLQWFTILFDTGKIALNVLQNAQQDYSWAVGQAGTDLIRPTIDQMQVITAMWNKLLPDTDNNFRRGFIHEGTEEHIIKH